MSVLGEEEKAEIRERMAVVTEFVEPFLSRMERYVTAMETIAKALEGLEKNTRVLTIHNPT